MLRYAQATTAEPTLSGGSALKLLSGRSAERTSSFTFLGGSSEGARASRTRAPGHRRESDERRIAPVTEASEQSMAEPGYLSLKAGRQLYL
jgi:hypothetical protein